MDWLKWDEMIPVIFQYALKVVVCILLLIIGGKCIAIFRRRMCKRMQKHGVEEGVITFVDSALKIGLYFLLIFLLLSGFGVGTATIVAVVTSSGVTLGLAFQGCLSNFAGGILILLTKPFKVGDYIKESASGTEGTVQKIDIIYTTVTTIDNKVVVIPNGTLANTSVINYTAQKKRIVDLTFGISYRADLTLKRPPPNSRTPCRGNP